MLDMVSWGRTDPETCLRTEYTRGVPILDAARERFCAEGSP